MADDLWDLSNDDEIQDTKQPVEPSALSKEIAKLKKTAFSAVNERERLPQPLFWSLFYSQISKIRSARLKKRIFDELL